MTDIIIIIIIIVRGEYDEGAVVALRGEDAVVQCLPSGGAYGSFNKTMIVAQFIITIISYLCRLAFKSTF